MEGSKLIVVLRSFSPKEQRAFADWLASPFFNCQPELPELYRYLSSCLQSPDRLDKKKVYAALFPGTGKPYDDLALRRLMSALFLQAKQYLSWVNWSANSAQVSLGSCKALRRRGLDEVFEKELKRAWDTLEQNGQRNADYHFYRYQFALEHWDFTRSHQRNEGSLDQANEAFETFAATSLLRHHAAALAQYSVTGGHEQDFSGKSAFLETTLKETARGRFAKDASVQFYYHSCLALEGENREEHFRQLLALIETQWMIFPQPEIKDLFTLAINFCIKRINTGAHGYLQEVFKLYQKGLETGIIFENGILSKYTYNNVLLTAAGLAEWEWALDFLERYKSSLAPRDRENTWQYNLAVYWFRRPDYGKVQEILQRVEFRDPLYNLDARRMLLRIYFENREWLALESHLDSFTMYLHRHRNIGYHRELNLNLVHFTKKLLRLEQTGEGSPAQLRTALEATTLVAERKWLLDKVTVS